MSEFRRDLLVVAGLAAAPTIALGFTRFAYALLLPAMRADLGWSFATAGLMNTVNAGGYLAGALATAWLVARVGQRPALGWSLATMVLALAGTATTQQIEVLLALRFVVGVAGAVSFVVGGAMTAAISRAHPGHQSAVLMGTYFAGGGVGIVVSGLAVPWVLSRTGPSGWPWGWLVLSTLAAAGSVAVALAARVAPAAPAQSGSHRTWPRGLGWLASGYLLFGAGYIGYMTFVIALLVQVGLPPQGVAVFWVLLGLAGTVSGVVWAGLLRRATGGSAASVLLVLLAAATVVPALTRWPPLLYLSGVLFGLCFLSLVAAVTAAARDAVAPAYLTAALSMLTTVFALGQVLGPWFTGLLADRPGGLQLGLGASAAVLLVAAVLCRMQRPSATPVPPPTP